MKIAPANADVLGKELDELLKHRDALNTERNELLTRLIAEEGKIPERPSADENAIGSKIASINTIEIPLLKTRIRDATNATRDTRERKLLTKLLGRITSALSTIRTDTEIDLSPAHEQSLRMKWSDAKTNSERIEIMKEINRIHRYQMGQNRGADKRSPSFPPARESGI